MGAGLVHNATGPSSKPVHEQSPRAKPMIRTPAVAGTFYPGDRESLVDTLRSITHQTDERTQSYGVVVPHAGYVYSGHVAGEVYSRLQLPDRYIILCPNHTGLGCPLSIMSTGEWETPMGNVVVDTDLARSLMVLDPNLEEDEAAHRAEHALELQLPFLQFLAGPRIQFVPITLGTSQFDYLERLGEAIAETVRQSEKDILIIASSDMNHYEPDEPTRVKDRKAIGKMLERDAAGLHEVVLREGISMCGFGPATSMLVAANRLGASRAELVKYATSGDAFGDRDRVVGYAGVIVS